MNNNKAVYVYYAIESNELGTIKLSRTEANRYKAIVGISTLWIWLGEL